MSPRIRSFLSRPFYVREAKPIVQKAPEPPTVFREFVETLQRLDAAKHPIGNGAARTRAFGRHAGNGSKRHRGNGHARPRGRTRPLS